MATSFGTGTFLVGYGDNQVQPGVYRTTAGSGTSWSIAQIPPQFYNPVFSGPYPPRAMTSGEVTFLGWDTSTIVLLPIDYAVESINYGTWNRIADGPMDFSLDLGGWQTLWRGHNSLQLRVGTLTASGWAPFQVSPDDFSPGNFIFVRMPDHTWGRTAQVSFNWHDGTPGRGIFAGSEGDPYVWPIYSISYWTVLEQVLSGVPQPESDNTTGETGLFGYMATETDLTLTALTEHERDYATTWFDLSMGPVRWMRDTWFPGASVSVEGTFYAVKNVISNAHDGQVTPCTMTITSVASGIRVDDYGAATLAERPQLAGTRLFTGTGSGSGYIAGAPHYNPGPGNPSLTFGTGNYSFNIDSLIDIGEDACFKIGVDRFEAVDFDPPDTYTEDIGISSAGIMTAYYRFTMP